MLKKPLFILALTASAASSFAFSPFNIMGTTHKKNLHNVIPKKAINTSTNFVDFSGTWIGKCAGSDGDENELETVTIKNDDMLITFNGESYSIGSSLKTESNSDASMTIFDHEAFFWNAEKNQLHMNGVFGVKSHETDNQYITPQIITTLGDFTFSIENDELITKGNIAIFQGSKQQHTQDFICTYKREVN